MSARITALAATAVLLASTAFAAAQSSDYKNGRQQSSANTALQGNGQISRHAAPHRTARADAYGSYDRNSWSRDSRAGRDVPGGRDWNDRDRYAGNSFDNRDSYAGRDWNDRDSYAGNYADNGQYGWRNPQAGYYDYAPGPGAYDSNGPGGYYDQGYWRGGWNAAPGFAPGTDPYAGAYFYDVAPW